MPTDGDAHADSDTPQNPPPPVLPPIVEGNEDGNGGGREDQGRKRQKTTKQPEHWSKGVEALCAILLVAITGGYTYFAGHQLGEMKRTNDLTQQALNGSNQSLSETLAEMQEQAEQMGRLADNAKAQADRTKTIAEQAVIQAKAANISANATSDTVKEMQANRHPWVGLDIEKGGLETISITINNDGVAHVTYHALVKNYGNYAAQDVWTLPQLVILDYPTGSFDTVRQMEKGLCSSDVTGDMVFPAQSFSMARYEISPFDLRPLMKDPKGQHIFTAFLVGCVNYKDQFGETFHTGFEYELTDPATHQRMSFKIDSTQLLATGIWVLRREFIWPEKTQ